MHIVSLGDNLHEVLDPIFEENKKNIISLLSAESALRDDLHIKCQILFSRKLGKISSVYCLLNLPIAW